MEKPPEICALCGIATATSREHIPPQSIFPKPRPSNLITVPSCKQCNNGTSAEDEKFKAYLSLHVGVETPETKALWEKHALGTLKHNNRLRSAIISSMRRIDVRVPSGIIIGRETGVLWDSHAHRVVIEKLVRGLYFYHSARILEPEAVVKTQWLRGLPKGLPDIDRWPSAGAGGSAFRYKYVFGNENQAYSTWLFCFYGRHWASGYTKPPE